MGGWGDFFATPTPTSLDRIMTASLNILRPSKSTTKTLATLTPI
jgi:hypothetical protein